MRTRVYAVRDAETKERLSYRYRTRKEAKDRLIDFHHTGRVLEVYATTMDLERPATRK